MDNFHEQEGKLMIGPLGKLGRFKSTVENILVNIASISVASGPILSLTSWNAAVLQLYKCTEL